jgi:ABC-type oligopeptide transport system ATPase subunit
VSAPLLEVRGLRKRYATTDAHGKPAAVEAVAGVDFTIDRGTTFGLIGESGCGKSTVAKLVLRLIEPSAGTIAFEGAPIEHLRGRELRAYRRAVQAVFQNPYSALNPRMRVREIVGEPLIAEGGIAKNEIADRVREQLAVVGLRPDAYDRFPHEFSGGQRQRIAIARALILLPALVVLDEPVSALDVSIRAQILNLLLDLQDRYGLSYLLISHDLAVVARMCDTIAVMNAGQFVAAGPTAAITQRPDHPYVQALFAATLTVPAASP